MLFHAIYYLFNLQQLKDNFISPTTKSTIFREH